MRFFEPRVTALGSAQVITGILLITTLVSLSAVLVAFRGWLAVTVACPSAGAGRARSEKVSTARFALDPGLKDIAAINLGPGHL